MRSRRVVLVGAAVVGGLAGTVLGASMFVGAVGAAETEANGAPGTAHDAVEVLASSDFPVNEQGRTYGSISESEDPREMPDLIGVFTDDGATGFLRKEDWLALEEFEDVASPEEALALEERYLTEGPPSLPVYDLSGERQIGTFTVDLGVVVPAPGGPGQ